jgi:hypothetical protein
MGGLLKLILQLLKGGVRRPPAPRPAPAKPPAQPRQAQQKADQQGNAARQRNNCSGNCSSLKKPVRRHDPCRTKGGDPTKERNSMIDPDYKDAINRDLDDIIAGKVQKTGETWNVNGRSYGMHNGSLHPVSGPGIVDLSRPQHQLIQQLNGNSLENARKFGDAMKRKGIMDQDAIDTVMELWRKCKK